jgi:hypothetical protein
MAHASGSFEVTVAPLSAADKADSTALGRLSLDKQFHGDLDGTSKGEMMTASTEANGSAAYVALERVTGTLHGQTGTFVLLHAGTMTRDSRELSVTVVPDSGTEQLAGLAGKMEINIVDKDHFYEFEYTLQ